MNAPCYRCARRAINYYYILQILHIESIENWKGGNM